MRVADEQSARGWKRVAPAAPLRSAHPFAAPRPRAPPARSRRPRSLSQVTNLSFEDFLEAFVRAAGMKSLPTDKVREPLVAAAAAARGSSARRRRRRAHAAARRTPHAARA